MKRFILLLCLCTTIGVAFAEQETSVTIQAWNASNQEYKKPIHYVGLGAKLGYSQFNMKNTGLQIPGGANAGLEFRYKLEKKAFRFTVGLDFTYAGNSFKGDLMDSRRLAQPTDEMVFNYNFKNLRETENVMEVGLPIMFGANFKGFYAQAGMRLGLPVWNSYNIKTDIETTITDIRAIEDYTNMPNHFLNSYSKDNKGKMALSTLNPQVSVEIGMNLDKWLQKKIDPFTPGYKPSFAELLHYEVALYANVGVMDYHKSPNGAFYTLGEGQIPEVTDVQTITDDNSSVDPISIKIHEGTPNEKEIYKYNGRNALATEKMIPWNVGVRFNIYYEILDQPKVPKKKRERRDRPDVVIIEEEPVVEEVVYQGDTIQQGDTIRLDNLYFDTDKTIIRRISIGVVEDLAKWLNDNPSVKITLVGHTDNVGRAAYNQKLSLGRVNSVKAELIKRGIGADRVRTIGKGMSEPIADNNTAEGRAKNRRVEIIIDEK